MESPTQQQPAALPPGEKIVSFVSRSDKTQEDIVAVEVVTGTVGDALEPTQPVMTKAMHHQWLIQFAVLCMASFLVGWSDAIIGPAVPRLREFYHVSLYSYRFRDAHDDVLIG